MSKSRICYCGHDKIDHVERSPREKRQDMPCLYCGCEKFETFVEHEVKDDA